MRFFEMWSNYTNDANDYMTMKMTMMMTLKMTMMMIVTMTKIILRTTVI